MMSGNAQRVIDIGIDIGRLCFGQVVALALLVILLPGCRDAMHPKQAPPIEWIEIESGVFERGDPIQVTEIPTFFIAKTETTFAQYLRCVEDADCSEPPTFDRWENTCFWSRWQRGEPGLLDENPVDCVDWVNAGRFCQFAGGRLPSEAEWEFAATSRGTRAVPSAENCETDGCCDLVVGSGGEWFQVGCGEGRPWRVCSKPTGNTEQGLCDMIGNVAEWARAYDDSLQYNFQGIRGGSWKDVLTGGRFWYREEENTIDNGYGFRCARSASDEKP